MTPLELRAVVEEAAQIISSGPAYEHLKRAILREALYKGLSSEQIFDAHFNLGRAYERKLIADGNN